jgi:NADPH-dependent 2,4-dienoyl-CoA reductase/sulfur reductase-like enzyme
MNRRQMLKTGVTFGAASVFGLTPWRSAQARSQHYDVVVIGAGMAGLAAIETIRKRGLSVALLEA